MVAGIVAHHHATCRDGVEHGIRFGIDDRTGIEAVCQEIAAPEVIVAGDFLDFFAGNGIHEWRELQAPNH